MIAPGRSYPKIILSQGYSSELKSINEEADIFFDVAQGQRLIMLSRSKSSRRLDTLLKLKHGNSEYFPAS